MAFWGVEIKAGKPYTHQFDDEKGRLHVSQATLGDGSSKNKTIVVCNVGDKNPIYLCSLFPKRMETCPLNVEFEEYEEVTLSVIGPHSVHLSGYYFGESPDDERDDNDCDSCEDYDLDCSDGGSDESLDYDSEDEEDDHSDSDMEMFGPSPTRSSGVRIEEITDDDDANEKDLSKLPKTNDNNENSNQQAVLKNASSVPVLESEDEDGFPVSSPAKNGALVSNSKETEGIMGEGTGGQLKRKINKNDSVNIKSAKRKKDDIAKNGDQERQSTQPSNISSPTPEVAKSAKKNKKKKQRDQEGKKQEGSKSTIEPEVQKNQNQTNEKGHDVDANAVGSEIQSKMKKNKSKLQENAADVVADKNGSTKKGKKAEAKPSQARSFSNGLVIEELEMGRPDGKRAAPGKKVSVRYIGKLMKNGKIFDSNIGKSPFKFRLGVGEVIKGWDVGVNGMRVGDKRRLTIPPAMGYGARGAGGTIPPNAWLLFDVELVDA